MNIPSVGCLFDRHKPVRDRVHTDGIVLTGQCKACGAQIWRRGYNDWRRGTANPRHA